LQAGLLAQVSRPFSRILWFEIKEHSMSEDDRKGTDAAAQDDPENRRLFTLVLEFAVSPKLQLASVTDPSRV
jgi:hypothetical protein